MAFHKTSFDAYDALIEAGAKEQLARTIIKTVEASRVEGLENVCTKKDIENTELKLELKIAEIKTELKQDIAEIKAELKQDMAEIKAELKQDMADVKAELKQDINNVRQEISGVKLEISELRGDIKEINATLGTAKWFFAGIIIPLLLVALKLFFPALFGN